MFRWIERVLFFITHKVVLLTVLLALIAGGFLGYQSLKQYFDVGNISGIQLSQYQNWLQNQQQTDNTAPEPLVQNQEEYFDAYIRSIVHSLEQLPDANIDKTDLNQRITLLVKIKSYTYPQDLQLSYAKSLAKLTANMIKNKQENLNIDQFFEWHDHEFAKQAKAKKQNNAQHHYANMQNTSVFFILMMISSISGIFLLFITMLAILRIEKNTRQ